MSSILSSWIFPLLEIKSLYETVIIQICFSVRNFLCSPSCCSKIKLKEVDKIYTIDNINDFIRDISLFLKDEQKCSEENNQDIKQSLQVEQSIAVEQEDDSEYNVYRTWWGKTFAIFVVVWLISMFTSHDWGTKDFSKKYSLRYSVSYSEVERVVGYDTPMFPIPYKRYKIEYNDGSEKTIGYKVLGLIFITDEI